MKLTALFNNDSNGGLSTQLESFLKQSLDSVNELIKENDKPTAVIILDDGAVAVRRMELVHHLTSYGIKSVDEYSGVLRPSEEGFARLIYKTALGKGFCDVLVEEAGPAVE